MVFLTFYYPYLEKMFSYKGLNPDLEPNPPAYNPDRQRSVVIRI